MLEEHLKNGPKNASYISKNSQNELIKCCGQVITEKIIEVKRNKFFSIIADEAADCSSKEQLSLVLRFVDDDLNISEDFPPIYSLQMGFVWCRSCVSYFECINQAHFKC